MHLASLASAAALALGVAAQCPRPTPPPAGLPVLHTLSVPVTYSDGYQTFGAMVLPTGAPPSCGWPLVVYVHPLGGSRFDEADLQLLVAQHGFAVWSYDVRGQGEAEAANPNHPNRGSTLWGPVERHDLAEQIQFVAGEPTWQGHVDATRVAVIGTSQGGGHAWLAAAWSGEALQTPGRTPTTFPTVRCVVARDLVANTVDDWVRGELFGSWWLEAVTGSYPALPLDPAMVQAARAAFVAQDPGALRAAWQTSGRDLADRLSQSVVPVLYDHAYLDSVSSPLVGVEQLEAMGGPGRALLGTLGHGVPGNDHERAASDNLQLRWLLRWLWDEANECDVEVPHVLSLLPLDTAQRDDPLHPWSRAPVGGLAPAAGAERLFLHGDFELRSAPPNPVGVDPRIEQVVAPQATTFGPVDYFDVPATRSLGSVLQACPLQELVWTRAVADDVELVGSPSLQLAVVPDQPTWMVAALLTVQPNGGDEVMIAHEAIGSRSSAPGTAEVHTLRLPPIATSIPSGATIRLRLRNLWLVEAPMTQRLAAAPVFGDFGVDVHLGPQPTGSFLDLPLRPVEPHLVVSTTTMPLVTADPIEGTVRGGAAHAGDPYFVAVGLSGSVPFTPYLNDDIPLDGDWLVIASAASTYSYYGGFVGFLDAAGEAACSIDYSSAAPLPQVLNGLHLTVAAFVWDYEWATTGESTNACEVMLR